MHNRIIFAGDAAHQVSPFGARGANSGIQDAENLAWKLAAVIAGTAPRALLDTYELERGQAADENIRHSTRSTDFIAPRTRAERLLRNAALDLAGHTGFAKRFINSGRLSVPTVYDTPISMPDVDEFAGQARLGAPVPDAPVTTADGRRSWLLEHLAANQCLALSWDDTSTGPEAVPTRLRSLVIGRDLVDVDGILARRLDATPGAIYLLRPDQHLCARSRQPDSAWLASALARAHGNPTGGNDWSKG